MSPQKAVFEAVFCRKWLLTAKPSIFDYIVLYIVGKLWISAFSWYFWKNILWILQSVRILRTHPDRYFRLGKHSFKKKRNFMKNFHTAFMKSLFRPKKRVNATYFVSRQKRVFILLHLLQVIFYNRSLFYFNHLYCYFAHQCFLFRLKIWHFKALTFLNKRYEIRLTPPVCEKNS